MDLIELVSFEEEKKEKGRGGESRGEGRELQGRGGERRGEERRGEKTRRTWMDRSVTLRKKPRRSENL